MKLTVSIVQNKDANDLISALTAKGYHATKICTTGGLLREGSATVLVGTEAESVPDILSTIGDRCPSRTQMVDAIPITEEPGDMLVLPPFEITAGGATVFVLNVDEFRRF